jgi:hypothetical protein
MVPFSIYIGIFLDLINNNTNVLNVSSKIKLCVEKILDEDVSSWQNTLKSYW